MQDEIVGEISFCYLMIVYRVTFIYFYFVRMGHIGSKRQKYCQGVFLKCFSV